MRAQRLSVAGSLVVIACLAGRGETPQGLRDQARVAPGALGGDIRGKVVCRGVRTCEGAVVYVEKIAGRNFPPGSDAVIDQLGLTFVPHVLPVVTGTTVAFPNSDDVRHNVFSASPTKRFNLGTYAKGVVRHVVFDKPGVIALLCNVHAEMSAYVIVSDTPYATRVRPDGTYLLEQVPAGTHTAVAWHEALEEQRRQVTVRDGAVTDAMFELGKS